MSKQLEGKKVAILAAEGFEQSELLKPQQALEEAGAEVTIVSLKTGDIKGWDETDWGNIIKVDLAVEDADEKDFDALHLPGGVMNPDKLRGSEQAVAFVKAFFTAGKPVSAICHAAWTLINAEVVEGREMTSYPTLQKDLENAGAKWVDREVVVDNGLVTSRNPDDLPAFNQKIIEVFAAAGQDKKVSAA